MLKVVFKVFGWGGVVRGEMCCGEGGVFVEGLVFCECSGWGF